MSEQLDLTTPTLATPGINNFVVSKLILDRDGNRISIFLLADNGERIIHNFHDSEATNLMIALNKANLTSNSLQKRILQKLLDDGVFAGTISGSPD